MRLCNVKKNKNYKIVKVMLEDKLSRRLADIGVYEGAYIKLIRKSISGSTYLFEIVIIAVALRRAIVVNIIVKEDA